MANLEAIHPWPEALLGREHADKTASEEWANGLSHAVGFSLSVLASVVLLQQVLQVGSFWQTASCLLYAGLLVALYAVSTLSHWVQQPIWKTRLRAWDQGLIFLFISANFTPFAVTCFHGWWHLITVVIWIFALAGCISKVAFAHRVNGIALWMYLGLGWLTALGLPQLFAAAAPHVGQLALAGGVAYTMGSALLMNDHRAPFLHVGWHVLVIVGSCCHYLAVMTCLCASR